VEQRLAYALLRLRATSAKPSPLRIMSSPAWRAPDGRRRFGPSRS
jgi:hypothetical protein